MMADDRARAGDHRDAPCVALAVPQAVCGQDQRDAGDQQQVATTDHHLVRPLHDDRFGVKARACRCRESEVGGADRDRQHGDQVAD